VPVGDVSMRVSRLFSLDGVIPDDGGTKKSLYSTGPLSSWVFLFPGFLHLPVFFGVFLVFPGFPFGVAGLSGPGAAAFRVGDLEVVYLLNSLLLFWVW